MPVAPPMGSSIEEAEGVEWRGRRRPIVRIHEAAFQREGGVGARPFGKADRPGPARIVGEVKNHRELRLGGKGGWA